MTVRYFIHHFVLHYAKGALCCIDDYAPIEKAFNKSIAWQFDCPEIGEGMIQAFRREDCLQESIVLKLKGVEADSKYMITDIDTNVSQEIIGKGLLENGLEIKFDQKPNAKIITYKKINATNARDYYFDGKISRKVLENYLSRSITMMDLLSGIGNVDDNIRMLINIGAKYAGRSLYVWGGESRQPKMLAKAKEIAQKIHSLDPDMILQAGIYEIITKDVEKVLIPNWVFEEFGLKPESRNFNFNFKLMIREHVDTLEQAKMIDDDIFSYPYISVSDTLQRMIFYNVAIDSNKDSTLVFEEPEVHAFPSYIKQLGEKIAFDETNQYFIVTHNPYLFLSIVEKTPKDNVNVFITYMKDYQTMVKQANDKEISKLMVQKALPKCFRNVPD